MSTIPYILISKGLTSRQAEVAALAFLGMDNKGIAEHLSVTESNVKFHLVRIYRKLKINSRHELIVLCHNLGIKK